MEKEQDMQKTIDVLKKAGEEMGREIISLKHQITGHKAANERYRKDLEKCKEKVSRLQVELDNAKAYGKEADELNEQKAQRIATLDDALKSAKANIVELSRELDATNDALSTAHEQVALVSQTNKDLSDKICDYEAQFDWYNNLPWYKKIFVKKI